MRLDFLHNYPLNQEANQILIRSHYPNHNIFSPINRDSKINLCKSFGANNSVSFGFDVFGICGILSYLTKDRKIAYGVANHQQICLAAESLGGFEIKLDQDGNICLESLEKAIFSGAKIFILPSINQDIFTQNNQQEIFNFIHQRQKDFLLLWDISLSLSLCQEILPLENQKTAYWFHSECLGLLRGFGFLYFRDEFDFPFILESSQIYEALEFAKLTRIQTKAIDMKKFFTKLKEELKNDEVSNFVPLQNQAPNTLSLRFFKIKARLLLQDLFIKKIYGVNGQECLFGLFRPSFVLQKMGYDDLERRELLAVSCVEDFDMDFIAKELAKSYRQLRSLGV